MVIRRWHDSDPEMAKAVAGLEAMKIEYQQVFGQIIIRVSEQIKTKKRKDWDTLVQIGADKVKGLMKSKSKRRWYDQTKTMHKAMNSMMLLEEEQRPELAKPINEAIELVNEYVEVCTDLCKTEDINVVINLAAVTVKDGIESGREYLEATPVYREKRARDGWRADRDSVARLKVIEKPEFKDYTVYVTEEEAGLKVLDARGEGKNTFKGK